MSEATNTLSHLNQGKSACQKNDDQNTDNSVPLITYKRKQKSLLLLRTITYDIDTMILGGTMFQ